MRLWLPLLSACAAAPAPSSTPAPPPGELSICVPPRVLAGQTITLVAEGADPGELVTFVRGHEFGPGPCLPALGDQCFTELVQPTVMTSVAADADGRASFSVTVPATAQVGTEVGFMSIVRRGLNGADSELSALSTIATVDADTSSRGQCDAPDVCVDADADGDGIHDACDVCPGGPDLDTNGDGTADGCGPGVNPGGLVAWWSFEGGSGADRSGSGHEASATGGTVVSGAVGDGVSLGAGQWFDYTATDAMDISDTLTISAWVNLTSTTGIRGIVADAARGGGVQDFGFYVWDGEVTFDVNFPSNETVLQSSGATIPTGVWTHVAGTYDLPGGLASFYVDGEFVSSTPVTSPLLTSAHTSAVIGTDAGFPHDLMGSLDELTIWSRVLSATEIAVLAQR